MKNFTTEEIRDLFGQVVMGEISFSQMTKVLNERMNERVREAEKKCVEDIPKRKFKKGDKVRIKHGVSSKTHRNIRPSFVGEMDDIIGKIMTVYRYSDWNNYVECNESDWRFHEDWLEPYVEELKEGDLAIFWMFDKTQAAVRLFDKEQGDISQLPIYIDNTGHWWANAIKFESVEQYKRLINGEI